MEVRHRNGVTDFRRRAYEPLWPLAKYEHPIHTYLNPKSKIQQPGDNKMKKKLIIIVSSCFLAIVILLFGAGLYLNANIEEITRKHLGAAVRFESVEFHYSPMPTIVFSGLEVENENNSVKIPSLSLYPDLLALIGGRISLKRVVMEKPLLLADFIPSGVADGNLLGASLLSTATIPAERVGGITVNSGKLILKGSGSHVQPVSFALAMNKIEKKDQTISVQVKDFSIDEIGLKFAGSVTISSLTPLKLKVDAPKASLNALAVKDFLVKFGFIKGELGDQIPKIESVGAETLKLNIDTESGEFVLSSAALNFDKNELKGVAINLSKGGDYQLKCANLLFDMETVHGWLMENPKGKEALDNLYAKAKLKSLSAKGAIALSSLDVKGTQGEKAAISGSVDVKTEGLKIHVVSEKGDSQDFTISQLNTKVIIEEGKPSVSVEKLKFSSSRGGTGSISGSFALPLKLKDVAFKGRLNTFEVFDTVLNLKAKKEKSSSLKFDFGLTNPSLEVLAEGGMVRVPPNRETSFVARLNNFRISQSVSKEGAGGPGAAGEETKDFNLALIKGKDLYGKALIKSFQFNDLPQIDDMEFELLCRKDQATVTGAIRVCGVNLSLAARFIPPSTVVAQVNGRGVSLNLYSFIACFSKELPIYLAGKLTVSASFFAKGDNPKALLDGSEGQVMATLVRCSVNNLSTLDYRLSFLMDILGVAGVNPDTLDSLPFDKVLARADLQKGRIVLDTFSLRGPVVDAWGGGEYLLKEKRLKLSGHVQTALGITEDLNIDKVLKRRKT